MNSSTHVYYRICNDLPNIPEDLENDAYECMNIDNCFYERLGINKYNVSPKITQWLNDFIIPQLDEKTYIGNISIQKITPSYSTNPPHTDGSGECVLFYFLTLGGTNVTTRWWQEKDEPLIRKLGIKNSDKENFKEVCSTVIPLKQWVSITSNIFHNVDDVTSDRISISIRLKQHNIITDNNF